MAPRTFTRVPVHVRASLRFAAGDEIHGRIRDLSLGGIGIESPAEVPEGTACAVRILLDGGGPPLPVDARGTVVRCAEGVVAVRIEAVEPAHATHFNKLILYNAPDAHAFEGEIAAHAEAPSHDPTPGG